MEEDGVMTVISDREGETRTVTIVGKNAAGAIVSETLTIYVKESEGIEMKTMTTKLARDRALSFVRALDKSPKVKSHLEALLGLDNVPSAEDFQSVDSKAVDRCGKFLAHLGATAFCLDEVHSSRPRQMEIEDLPAKAAAPKAEKARSPKKPKSSKKARSSASAAPKGKAKKGKGKAKTTGPKLVSKARKVESKKAASPSSASDSTDETSDPITEEAIAAD